MGVDAIRVMAMAYYFKKLVPATAVMIPGVAKLQFTSIDGGLTGYFGTQNEQIGQALRQMIVEQRYGLTEISEAEFHADYVEKKKQGRVLPTNWNREQMGGRGLEGGQGPIALHGPERVAAVVGSRRDESLALETEPPASFEVPERVIPVQPGLQPVVGKRKKPPEGGSVTPSNK